MTSELNGHAKHVNPDTEKVIHPDDVKMVNCASCGDELLGMTMSDWWWALPRKQREEWPPLMRGYVRGRPYCRECMKGGNFLSQR